MDLGRRYYARLVDPARALNLLDAACATVRVSRGQPPREVLSLESRLRVLSDELARLEGDVGDRVEERRAEIDKERVALEQQLADQRAAWVVDQARDE